MRKLTLTTLLLLTISVIWAQGYPVLVDSDRDHITLNITGYGEKELPALDDAQLNAIKTMLFTGVPGAKGGTRIIAQSEASLRTQKPEFMPQLERVYKNFIISCIPVGKLKKYNKKIKQIQANVKVNTKALREFASQSNVSFGL